LQGAVAAVMTVEAVVVLVGIVHQPLLKFLLVLLTP
jgi:hypothetical protein